MLELVFHEIPMSVTNDEFIRQAQLLWDGVSMEVVRSTIHSMPARVQAVIESKGLPTKF